MEALTRKVGGLPVWAWLGIAVVGYLAYKRYAAAKAASTATTAEQNVLANAYGNITGAPYAGWTSGASSPGQGASGTSPGSGAGTPGTAVATPLPGGQTLPQVSPALGTQVPQGTPGAVQQGTTGGFYIPWNYTVDPTTGADVLNPNAVQTGVTTYNYSGPQGTGSVTQDSTIPFTPPAGATITSQKAQ